MSYATGMAMAAMGAWLQAVAIVLTIASMIYQLVQSKKKTPAQNNEAAEVRKGFETVVEGEPGHLALVYGRAKVGGIRVYHNTSSDFNFVTSNADKSFGESLTPAVVQSGSYTMLETNSVTGESAIVSHNYAYGTSTMLDRSYTNGSRNEFLYFQQALCIGPINDVIDVIIDESRYLDDPALGTYGSVPAGNSYTADEDPSKTKWNDSSKPRSAMRIDAHYTEAGLNKSDAIISQNFPDRSNATFTGMAYISAVVRIDRDDPQFSGVPGLQFLVEGKLIRKVTNGVLNTVWEYSNNPVWCLLDYLMDTTSGGSVDVTEIALTTFEFSAPIAETVVQSNVTVGGKIWKSTDGKKNVSTRGLPLYECNIMIDTKKPVRENVEAILATMGDARLVWSGGKYKLSLQYPGQSNSNIILAAALTEDNLIMDQDIEMAWPTASERLNHCIVRFSNETENFKEDSVSWPPKYSGTSLVGIGGTRYPLADYSYDEGNVGGRFLNNYGVWSTATNSATLTYNIIIRKVDIGDMVLEYTADDSMTIKIYNDSNTELYTYSKSDWTTLGSQTVTLGNASADKVYKIVITGSNSGGDKAIGAKLTKGSKVIWTTREIAYSSVITVIKDNTVYQTMLFEDSNTPLEMEQFFEGATDRYHALAKAEELVRTSRTSYSIKFKYIINEKYLEPGDFITLTSETLGLYNEYFRINSVKITEENSCEVQAQMFDHTHLAWYQKDDEYQKPNNIYSMSIPAPAWIVYEPSNNALTNSSGTLTWAPVSFSEFAGYVLYMYEAGGPRTSGNLPIFNEIGRAVDTSFVLPKLSTPSAFFAVRTISRAGKLSNFTYSSTEEAEFFIDTVYKFEGLVLTPTSSTNRIAWNAFNVYKDGVFLKTVAAGDALWTTGVLYLYFDIKSTDANQYTVRSTTLLPDLKNNKILGTYSGGIAYTMQNSELFPPTNLHLEGKDAPITSNGVLTIPFNTKDIVFAWSNALPNKAKSVTLDKYVLQFYTYDTNTLKATEVITPDNKLDGQYSMSFEKNASIFGTATRKFKIKLFALDSAGYLSSTSLDATFDNAKPSAVTLDFTSVFNAAYLKVPVVSDIDVLKYVFKQYNSAGTVLQKSVETTSSFIDFEATAGTTFKYTVTLCDAFGAGDESSSVEVIAASVEADTYTYTGLQFTPDAVTNKVSWSSFQYSKNGAALVTVSSGTMPTAWTSGKLFYLYLNTSTNTVLATESLATAVTGRILATYKGGTELTADEGKAFISGDQLLAGTVGANQLASDTLITNKAQIGNVIESSVFGWPHASGPNVGMYEGWRIDKSGYAAFKNIEIRGNNGNLVFKSGEGFNWTNVLAEGGTNLPAANATVGATWGTNISGQPSNDLILNNLQTGAWVVGQTPPWGLNGTSAENAIDYDTDVNGVKVPVWKCIANADGNEAGGWYKNEGDPSFGKNWFKVDKNKPYRFAVPVKITGGSTGSYFWGIGETTVCDLNTSNKNSNPYFVYGGRSGLVANRWYLLVGYVFPAGSTGNTNAGSGIFDLTTGELVSERWNYCWASDVEYTGTRAYQYYCANAGETQVFGYPTVEIVDGTESKLFDNLGYAALLNAQQKWSDVSGTGKPADYADVTNYSDARVSNVIEENNTLLVSRPVGASFNNNQSAVTGMIRIILPQGFTYTMMKFTVNVYTFNSDKSFSLNLAGYNHYNSGTWYNTEANLLGSTAADNRVRFGYDSTLGKCCIYIGEPTSSWSYPKVMVKDFIAGYLNFARSQWETGWAIDIVTSAPQNVTQDYADALIDAASIKNQGALATKSSVSYGSDITNLPGLGANRLVNTDFKGITGWFHGWNPGGANIVQFNDSTTIWGVDAYWRPKGSNALAIEQAGIGSNDIAIDIYNGGIWGTNDQRIAVKPNTKYEFSARIAAHNCIGIEMLVAVYNSNGDNISTWSLPYGSWYVPGSGGPDLSNYTQYSVFFVSDPTAAYVQPCFRKGNTQAGQVSSWMWITQPYFGEAAPSQTTASAYVAGPAAGAFANVNKITADNASTYIDNAAIKAAMIGSLSLVGADKFSVKSSDAGARMEMNEKAIKIYDASGILRVQLGDLST